MRTFRARTLALVEDLDDRQMIGPRLSIVNPPLWEIGHVAWTQELWTLRHLYKRKPLLENGDQLYNSTDVAHDARWELRLPGRDATIRYMESVLAESIQRLERSDEISKDNTLLLSAGQLSRGDARRSAGLYAPDSWLSGAAIGRP